MMTSENRKEITKEYKYTRDGKNITVKRRYITKLPDKNRYSGEFDNISDELLAAKTYALKHSIYNQHYRPISASCFYRHFNQWLDNRNKRENEPMNAEPTPSMDK